MSENNYHRRSVLKFLGLSTAGIAIFQGATITADKLASNDEVNDKSRYDEFDVFPFDVGGHYPHLRSQSSAIPTANHQTMEGVLAFGQSVESGIA